MAHFTPENEELCPEPTLKGEGRWKREASEKRREKTVDRRNK
jgi:hypothetical protein